MQSDIQKQYDIHEHMHQQMKRVLEFPLVYGLSCASIAHLSPLHTTTYRFHEDMHHHSFEIAQISVMHPRNAVSIRLKGENEITCWYRGNKRPDLDPHYLYKQLQHESEIMENVAIEAILESRPCGPKNEIIDWNGVKERFKYVESTVQDMNSEAAQDLMYLWSMRVSSETNKFLDPRPYLPFIDVRFLATATFLGLTGEAMVSDTRHALLASIDDVDIITRRASASTPVFIYLDNRVKLDAATHASHYSLLASDGKEILILNSIEQNGLGVNAEVLAYVIGHLKQNGVLQSTVNDALHIVCNIPTQELCLSWIYVSLFAARIAANPSVWATSDFSTLLFGIDDEYAKDVCAQVHIIETRLTCGVDGTISALTKKRRYDSVVDVEHSAPTSLQTMVTYVPVARTVTKVTHTHTQDDGDAMNPQSYVPALKSIWNTLEVDVKKIQVPESPTLFIKEKYEQVFSTYLLAKKKFSAMDCIQLVTGTKQRMDKHQSYCTHVSLWVLMHHIFQKVKNVTFDVHNLHPDILTPYSKMKTLTLKIKSTKSTKRQNEQKKALRTLAVVCQVFECFTDLAQLMERICEKCVTMVERVREFEDDLHVTDFIRDNIKIIDPDATFREEISGQFKKQKA